MYALFALNSCWFISYAYLTWERQRRTSYVDTCLLATAVVHGTRLLHCGAHNIPPHAAPYLVYADCVHAEGLAPLAVPHLEGRNDSYEIPLSN